ncbi:polysaccharide pyruvyl transferase family protein [Cryobacterium melibiosiphilum]|uniref:Polysaccharide pyruvyl transferase family protein n=1 Tax=Cryobacterium melibiosiphilum TaxID=995039 RepID=A0A3A5MUW0_9MICO|nr:polysaccharide pyruvyl transferase family protein [Cryobacterium melibiosiphilum]
MIILLDPSIASSNVGDQIIRQKVDAALHARLPIAAALPTQVRLGHADRLIARKADLAIIGGTNLLSSNMPFYQQWKLDPASIHALKGKVLLLGVGWWQYQEEPNAYTRWVLGQVLSRDHVHSVRDEYTKQKLENLGFQARNTACPTMWDLRNVTAGTTGRPTTVVVTLTDYNKDRVEDPWLIDLLHRHYDRVVVWPQAKRDAAYARELRVDDDMTAPTLDAFDELLTQNVDYIGTRLHGGIRAFDRGVWGLIVAVDNRALEIGRDTGLPVHARGDRASIEASVEARITRRVDLPQGEIDAWRAQFETVTAG